MEKTISQNKEYFVIIQQCELEMAMSPAEKLVYFSIKSFTANGKQAKDLSLRDISSRSGISCSHAVDIIPKLIEKKLIERIGEKSRVGGKVPIYKVCDRDTLKCSAGEHLTPDTSTKLSVRSLASNPHQRNISLEKEIGVICKEEVMVKEEIGEKGKIPREESFLSQGKKSWKDRLAVVKQEHSITGVARDLGMEIFGSQGNSLGMKCFSDTHQESNPSLVLMPKVNRFECKSCGIKGDVLDLIQGVRKISFKEAVTYLEPSFYKISSSNLQQIDPEKYLESRGIKPETAKKFNLLVKRDRLVIPVLTGERYRFFKGNKFYGNNKYGCKAGTKACLFKTEIQTEGRVFLTEGELDSIILWQETGYPAWSGTAGAATFKKEWVQDFAGIEKIYISYDTDREGQIGAVAAAGLLGQDRCFDVLLPSGIKDLTDYFLTDYTKKDFDLLIGQAKSFRQNDSKDYITFLQGRIVRAPFQM